MSHIDERRTFLRFCCQATITTAGLGFFLQACASPAFYAVTDESAGKVMIKKSEFLDYSSVPPKQRQSVLVRVSAYQFPICVSRLGDNRFSAVLLRCTHKGCEVDLEGDTLSCPCHGSEFSLGGRVLQGPADRDLKSFKMTEDNDRIYVWI
jgi:cytochrome b6-f complex iron-sulfur subunit